MGRYRSLCKIIAVAGSTASGKTTFANKLKKKFKDNKVVIICQDNYYKDWSHLNKKERKKINFDDLKAFDLRLLIKHLDYLKNGMPVCMPLYDFVQSRRLKKVKKINPKQVIIVEGLMPFFDKKLRQMFDYKIYIDTSNAVCLARRLKRDTKERGETVESVCFRYFNDVLPMQRKYVEPQKKWADVVINGKTY
ncbi:MAG: uridine kinase [Candidatus Omnitrophota bacterium]